MVKSSLSVRRMVGIAILVALVVILQMLGSFIHVGPVSISLTLLPIVIGAAMYGPGVGALLGFVFSLVVFIATVSGTDAGAFIMWSARPFLTLLVIFLKGTLAGYVAGLVFHALKEKNQTIGAILAAVVCPVVNTGIFLFFMFTGFQEILASWAGGTNVVTYAIVGLVGINFLVELIVNVILSPVILRVIDVVKK